MSRQELITCDICKSTIEKPDTARDLKHVNAHAYGRDFHLGCLKESGAIAMLRLLGLDSITVDGVKLISSQLGREDL